MAGTALRELLALFQIGVDSEELEKGQKQLQTFVGRVRKVGEVVAEAFAVHFVKEFFEQQIEGAAHVQDLADKLDVSATSLRTFGMVAQGAGLEFDTAAHLLSKFEKVIGEATIGGGEGAAALRKLGVDVHGSAVKSGDLMAILTQVSAGMSKLPDHATKVAYATKLFGREGAALVPILSQSSEKMAEMLKEADELSVGLGDEYYAASKKAREEGEKFGFAMQSIKGRISAAALPAITAILKKLKDTALQFIEVTKKTYILQTAMLFLSGIAGYKLVQTITAIAHALGILKPTILETLGAMLQFAAPIIIIGALYLIFDDLFTLIKGGQSVIGDVVDDLFGVGAAASAILYVNAAFEDTVRIFKDISAIIAGAVIPPFVELWHIVEGVAKALGDLATLNFSGAVKDIEKMTDALKKDALAGVETIKSAGKDLLGGPAMKVEALHTLLAAGVDPKLLMAHGGKEGLDRAVTAGAAEPQPGIAGGIGTREHIREPVSFSRTPAAYRQPVYAAPPAAAAAPVVRQTNTFNTTVHTSSDDPKSVGEATGQGVSTAAEKATNNAIQNVRRQ
jgi:hypothetical protein